jgi:hypothetical protein
MNDAMCLVKFFVDDELHDVDVFKSWPGYAMLAIRIVFTMWFLVEIRTAILRSFVVICRV